MRRRPQPSTLPGALVATGVLAALVVASGCGVVSAGAPNAIPKGQVPFHLLTKEVPTTTSTTAPVATVAVTVYFVGQTHQFLVPATRAVPAPPSLHTVLEELLAGPTIHERTAGVHSAISDAVRLRSVKPAVVKPSADVVTVDFNTAFGLISGTQQVQAVAQVVFTVTSQWVDEIGVQLRDRRACQPTSPPPPGPRWPDRSVSYVQVRVAATTSATTSRRRPRRVRRRRPRPGGRLRATPPVGRPTRGARGRRSRGSPPRRRGPRSPRSP